MKLVISDLHTQLFAQALLEPGEQLAGKVMAKEEPWYTRFLRFDFLMPYTLFLATDRRLILLEHKRRMLGFGYELASIESVPWSDVEELAAKGLFAKNKIRLKANTRGGAKRVTMNIPMWAAPLRNNGRELKNVVGTFQARRSLPPAGMPYMQAPQAYGNAPALNPSSIPPAYAQQPPQQQYQQPAQSQQPQPQYPQQAPYQAAPPGYGPPYNGS